MWKSKDLKYVITSYSIHYTKLYDRINGSLRRIESIGVRLFLLLVVGLFGVPQETATAISTRTERYVLNVFIWFGSFVYSALIAGGARY